MIQSQFNAGLNINIEHIHIGPLDLGIKGKENFVSLFFLGIVFYQIGTLFGTGGIGQWFIIFGVLMIVGAIYLFVQQLDPKPRSKK